MHEIRIDLQCFSAIDTGGLVNRTKLPDNVVNYRQCSLCDLKVCWLRNNIAYGPKDIQGRSGQFEFRLRSVKIRK